MRACRYGLTSRITKYTMVSFFPIVAALTFLTGLYCLYYALAENGGGIFPFLLCLGTFTWCMYLSFFIISFSINCYKFENRKYKLTTAGIIIKDKYSSLFEWAKIEDIVIVAYGASASRQNYDSVICCLLHPLNDEFLKKMLCSYNYGIKNTKRFIVIDYSPETVAELASLYPKGILDFRQKQLRNF